MDEESRTEELEVPELGSAKPEVAAPFSAAMRAHFQLGWPQALALVDSEGKSTWITTSVWFGQDRFREEILDSLLPTITGPVLDVGTGGGRAALKLQDAGIDVLAIDCDPACVDIARSRGVRRVAVADIREFETEERFATILFLDSTFGLVGSAEGVAPLLRKLESLLTTDGRIIVQDAEVGDVREAQWRFHYREQIGKPFRWLNLGLTGLRSVVRLHGWDVQQLARGPGPYYVAELTRNAERQADVRWARWFVLAIVICLVIAAGTISR